MTHAARDVLKQALELTFDERAKVAAELLESLEEKEEQAESAWAAEIRERVAAARAGELDGEEWRTVLARVEKDILGR